MVFPPAKRLFKGAAAFAAGTAAILGLYFALVRTSAVSVTLTEVTGNGVSAVDFSMLFMNGGDTMAMVSEVDAFISSSTPLRGPCSGEKVVRHVFTTDYGEKPLIIKSGEQTSRQFRLSPKFDGEGRFSLCARFETNTPGGVARTDPIVFFDFSVLEGELDSRNLDQSIHRIAETRSFRPF